MDAPRLKIVLAATICGAAVIYVAHLGLSTTWQYYVLVDECQEQRERFHGKRLRVSGRVASGSLSISEDRRHASFVLSGEAHRIPARCSGPVPDNLAECMDVVVEGELTEDGQLRGQRVITRCASKYAPKEDR
jgi:cytochrome c-type biogenesis protein CcmE